MASTKEIRSRVRRATSYVSGLVTRVFHRRQPDDDNNNNVGRASVRQAKAVSRAEAPPTSRPVRRETDIPLDVIASAYTPRTSMKSGFRSDGRDRQADQEFTLGTVTDGFNDEDRYTNKSGDPRIGTHGRQYEPGERERKTSS